MKLDDIYDIPFGLKTNKQKTTKREIKLQNYNEHLDNDLFHFIFNEKNQKKNNKIKTRKNEKNKSKIKNNKSNKLKK